MSRQHANLWSHQKTSWSPKGDSHSDQLTSLLFNINSPPILRYIYFKIWPWKSKVKVMAKIKTDDTAFEALCSINTFIFRYMAIGSFCHWDIANWIIFDLDESHGQGQSPMIAFEAESSIDMFVFSMCGNQTIPGWGIANSTIDLENSKVKVTTKNLPKSNR